jgi:hypothetical protein
MRFIKIAGHLALLQRGILNDGHVAWNVTLADAHGPGHKHKMPDH